MQRKFFSQVIGIIHHFAYDFTITLLSKPQDVIILSVVPSKSGAMSPTFIDIIKHIPVVTFKLKNVESSKAFDLSYRIRERGWFVFL